MQRSGYQWGLAPVIGFIFVNVMLRGKALLVAIVFIVAACNDYEERSVVPAYRVGQGSDSVVLTVDAYKTSFTRGLLPPDEADNIAAIWSEGDLVTVLSANGEELGTMTPMTTGSASTKLRATLNSPVNEGDQLTLVFPRMALDYTGQKGTLEDIAANYDYATAQVEVKYVGDSFISATDAHFTNQQAIVKFTLTTSDVEKRLNATDLTVVYGNNRLDLDDIPATNYTTDPGVLFVALPGFSGQAVTLIATVGSDAYIYEKNSVTIDNGGYYGITVKMARAGVNLAKLTSDYEAKNGEVLIDKLAKNVKISIAAGAAVTLYDANINGDNKFSNDYAGITCEGDATIKLRGTNTVRGFGSDYPGIYVPDKSQLTIAGDGALTVRSKGQGAGIGGGYGSGLSCGNIQIEGGTITATGGTYCAGIGGGRGSSCGTINISGGTIKATGGYGAAGIGSGGMSGASCGNITITNGVTSVTATKGNNSPHSIGKGYQGSCGTVTIGGTTGAISDSPYTYKP